MGDTFCIATHRTSGGNPRLCPKKYKLLLSEFIDAVIRFGKASNMKFRILVVSAMYADKTRQRFALAKKNHTFEKNILRWAYSKGLLENESTFSVPYLSCFSTFSQHLENILPFNYEGIRLNYSDKKHGLKPSLQHTGHQIVQATPTTCLPLPLF